MKSLFSHWNHQKIGALLVISVQFWWAPTMGTQRNHWFSAEITKKCTESPKTHRINDLGKTTWRGLWSGLVLYVVGVEHSFCIFSCKKQTSIFGLVRQTTNMNSPRGHIKQHAGHQLWPKKYLPFSSQERETLWVHNTLLLCVPTEPLSLSG